MAKFIYFLVIIFVKLLICECENVVLNISAKPVELNTNKINSNTYFVNGLPCKKFAPKPNNSVKKVMEGNIKVWEDSRSECTDAIVYPETDRPKLVHLFITTDVRSSHEYYSREGDKWTKIDEAKYRTLLDEFLPQTSRPSMGKKKGSFQLPSLFIVFLQFFLYSF
uniref:SfiI-subtelomeric related protein family member n=1 Tax=Theileria annulata TaxID=5874 RepID=A0A3B0N2W3_THEAN